MEETQQQLNYNYFKELTICLFKFTKINCDKQRDYG